MARPLFTVMYRMGGMSMWSWHRTVPLTLDEARKCAAEIRQGGRVAHVVGYALSVSIGLPETFEPGPIVTSSPVHPSMDLSRPEVLRDWSLREGYRPYYLAESYEIEMDPRDVPLPVRKIEMISWPWFEDGAVRINVREIGDSTTLRTVVLPQLVLRPTGETRCLP